MEFAYYGGSVSLAVVASRTAFSLVKSWWNQKSLKEQFIALAEQEQFEVQHSYEEEEFVDLEPVVRARPKKHKGLFRNFLVREGKAKFGCPSRTQANQLVVRKYLYDLCKEHGVYARHIVDNLDIAAELVFVPSHSQMVAASVRHTKSSQLRCGTYASLVGPRPDQA